MVSARCRRGLRPAQYSAYAFGQGVPQDDGEAVGWLRLAANQGDTDAQHNLGVMYAEGRGVAKDDVPPSCGST